MLSYLILHMLQAECESNHYKKKESRGCRQHEAIPAHPLSLSFHSWHSQSLYPSPAALCMTKENWKEMHQKCRISVAHLGQRTQEKKLYPKEFVAPDATVSCVPIFSQDRCLHQQGCCGIVHRLWLGTANYLAPCFQVERKICPCS